MVLRFGFNSFTSIVLFFYMFAIIALDSSFLFYISAALLVAMLLIYRIKNRYKYSIKSPFIILMLLFIAYNSIQIYLGYAAFPSVSVQRLFTVFLNFVIGYLIFYYCIDNNNRIKLMKVFICANLFFIIYLLLVSGQTLLSARFGEDVNYPFGISQKYNSNMVCIAGYTSFAFSYILKNHYREYNKKNSYYLITIFQLFLLFTIIMSGSRAGVIVTIILITMVRIFSSENSSKMIRNLLIAIIALFVLYFLIMEVDFLYDVLGKRLEVLLNGLGKDAGFEAGTSVELRQDMMNYAYELFWKKPLLGWGFDAFSQLFRFSVYSHNNFTEILVSCGLVGFVLYYFAISYLIVRMCSLLRKNRSYEIVVLGSLLFATLLMNVAHVDYVNRKSLLILYVSAALVVSGFEKKRVCNQNLIHNQNK